MIIFDLDGTIANCEHRRHFVDPRLNENYEQGIKAEGRLAKLFYHHKITKEPWKPNWDAFYEACNEDLAIWPVVRVIESLGLNKVTLEDADIQIWSGRSESVRAKTKHWLKYIIGEFTYSKLKMRPIGDSTPDDVLKERWLDEALTEGKTIDYIFDDRPKVVRMWRRRGVFVFNCNQSDEEF